MDKSFCIFGDSVTQAAYVKAGWTELLKQYLEKKYQNNFINFFNLGIGGNTTSDVLKRFEIEASFRTPTSIIFNVGINDSGYFKEITKSIIKKTNFKTNLEKIISKAKAHTKDITFIGLCLGDDSILKPPPGNTDGKCFDKKRMEAYDKLLENIARKNSCRFIKIWENLNDQDFLDGLHPNDQGHQKMFQVISKYF
ncbi:MAG: GDSL-type esterase/lipase family protein [Candidatus Shapirobacteria bacterium]